MKPDVHLRIEELVLDGFDPRDRHGISDALERELARLLRISDLRAISRSEVTSETLDAGSMVLPSSAPARDVGARIASALHVALGGREK